MKKLVLLLFVVMCFTSAFSQRLNSRGQKMINKITLYYKNKVNKTIIFEYDEDNNLIRLITPYTVFVKNKVTFDDGMITKISHKDVTFENITEYYYDDSEILNKIVCYSNLIDGEIADLMTYIILYFNEHIEIYLVKDGKTYLIDVYSLYAGENSIINDTNVNLNWVITSPYSEELAKEYVYITEWCGNIQEQLIKSKLYKSGRIAIEYKYEFDENHNIVGIRGVDNDLICRIEYLE